MFFCAWYINGMKNFHDIHQKPVTREPHEEVVWRISAYAIVKSEEGKILLVLPKLGIAKWVLPGGGIEPDEGIAEGIERECYEETGYKIKVDATHPIYVGESNFYDEDEYKHSINFVYSAKLLSDKQDEHVINSIVEDEIEEVRWFELSEINEENCHPIMHPAIKNLM